jgi:HD superfamily phosphohydrolase
MSTKYVNDPVTGHIALSSFEEIILPHPLMTRLHYTSQTSMAFRVYPAATTSRYIHSLGVMHIASMMFRQGIVNATTEIRKSYLESKYSVVQEALLSGLGSLSPADAVHLRNRYGFGSNGNGIQIETLLNDLEIFLGVQFSHSIEEPLLDIAENHGALRKHHLTYLLLLQTLRLYALFHDIGHLPYSHLLERAIQILCQASQDNTTRMGAAFSDRANPFSPLISPPDRSKAIHEYIGKVISRELIDDVRTTYSGQPIKAFFTSCFLHLLTKMQDGATGPLNCLHMICDVKYGIDADRIDFTQRDGMNSGLCMKSGDVERVYKTYCLTLVEGPDHFTFLPSLQSLNDIQELVSDRVRIYRFLVNHHKVKKLDYLLMYSIWKYLECNIEDCVKRVGNPVSVGDLNETFDIIDLVRVCIQLFQHNTGDPNARQQVKWLCVQLAQFTDPWLYTQLCKFHNHLEFSECQHEQCCQNDQHRIASEFIREIAVGQSAFSPLWKRDHEYNEFLEELGQHLQEDNQEILNHLIECYNLDTSPKFHNNHIQFTEAFRAIKEQMIRIRNDKSEEFCSFVHKNMLKYGIIAFAAPIDYKTGVSDTDTAFRLVDLKDQNQPAIPFNKLSRTAMSLRIDRGFISDFFVYYHSEGNGATTRDNARSKLMSVIKDYFELDMKDPNSLTRIIKESNENAKEITDESK